MADYLASIYGTEKDKVNCSFYFKIGACRHGEKCSRKHVKPTFSQTLLLPNIYLSPLYTQSGTTNEATNSSVTLRNINISDEELQAHFDLFYEDLFVELANYGELDELNVCDNVGDHLVGNVYAKYRHEEDACKACDNLNDRFYAGRPIYAELSPVTDFRESCCRQYDMGECTRGGFCNFMHLKKPSEVLKRELMLAQRKSIKIKREERIASRISKNSSSRHRRDRSDEKSSRRRDRSAHKSSRRRDRSAHKSSHKRDNPEDRRSSKRNTSENVSVHDRDRSSDKNANERERLVDGKNVIERERPEDKNVNKRDRSVDKYAYESNRSDEKAAVDIDSRNK